MHIWSMFGVHSSAIAAFKSVQTNHTKQENEFWYDLTELNDAGVNAPEEIMTAGSLFQLVNLLDIFSIL